MRRMKKATFVGTLSGEPDEGELEEIRKEPPALLNWLLTRTMLGEGIPKQGLSWLKEQAKEAGKKRKGDLPLWPLVRLSSVAAAQELTGGSGEKAAVAATDHILPASKKTDWERGVAEMLSCTLALLMYFEEEETAGPWREKRFGQQLVTAAAPSMFQVLYLSCPEASQDEIERLALETARVAISVIEGLSNQYTAPLLLALAPHARAADTELKDLLFGAARTLDGAASDIELEGPSFELVERGERTVLRAVVTAKGKGRLWTGPVPVLPLTAHFTEHLSDFMTETRKLVAAKKVSGKPILNALSRPEGEVQAVLRLDPASVVLEASDRAALVRRFDVAFRHARGVVSKLRCPGSLSFEDLGSARLE